VTLKSILEVAQGRLPWWLSKLDCWAAVHIAPVAVRPWRFGVLSQALQLVGLHGLVIAPQVGIEALPVSC